MPYNWTRNKIDKVLQVEHGWENKCVVLDRLDLHRLPPVEPYKLDDLDEYLEAARIAAATLPWCKDRWFGFWWSFM